MTLQSIDRVPKLYLLTNDDELTTLLDKLERVFDTGAVSLLQVRRKSTLKLYDLATVYREAEMIVSLANDYDIKVVMNDNLELASHFGTGLHLGQRDGSVRVAREILGDDVVIGRTCHTDIALFKEAKREGATYGAMGTVFGYGVSVNRRYSLQNYLKRHIKKSLRI